MPLSSIPITDGEGDKRLATATITQSGDTVSLPRIIYEGFADAAPDTFSVVALPKPAAASGDLVLIWGANGSDRQIYVPRIEIQQIKAATSNTLIRLSVMPKNILADEGTQLREMGQILVPQPVDPRGPLTMIGVNESTYTGTVTYGGETFGGLYVGSPFPWLAPQPEAGTLPDPLASGAIDPVNPGAYRAWRYAVKPLLLSTAQADFDSVVFDFAKLGQYPMIRGGGAITVQTDDDMNDGEILIRITMIQHEV